MPDYRSENVNVDYLSDLSPEAANELIGKTIAKISAREYGLTITFTDGSELECSGNRWGDCAMGVTYNK